MKLKNNHFKPLMVILIDAKKGYIYILPEDWDFHLFP